MHARSGIPLTCLRWAAGADLPSFVATPGRRGPVRPRTNAGISRPASIHVDAFMQRAGSDAPSPSSGPRAPMGPGGAQGFPSPAAQQLQQQVMAAAAAAQHPGVGGPSLAQLLADPAVRMVLAPVCLVPPLTCVALHARSDYVLAGILQGF